MTTRAGGTFEVRLAPLALHDPAADPALGRMSIDKAYTGGLVATGTGEMLTAMTAVKGSAGYVAIERVVGALDGRVGTFVLQHSGTMDRGGPRLSIAVVPDSGTGGLAGLEGAMAIEIEGGTHSYVLEYRLPEPP